MSEFGDELIESLKQAVAHAKGRKVRGTRVTIPAKDWERFEAWAHTPAREVAGLKELAKRPPTWRK
jgi:shikimate 5-dehydrogenase